MYKERKKKIKNKKKTERYGQSNEQTRWQIVLTGNIWHEKSNRQTRREKSL